MIKFQPFKNFRKFCENLDDLIDRLKNSIKFNGFYIILSLAFPLLLVAMGAGKEIFLILLNRSQYFNNVLIDASFLLLSYCLWIVPALSIYFFRQNLFGDHSSIEKETNAFHTLAKVYNGVEDDAFTRKQIAVRYLATLPFVLFVIGLVYNYFVNDWSIIPLVAFFTSLIIFFYWFSEFMVKKIYKFKKIKLLLLVIYVLTVFLYTWFYDGKINYKFWNFENNDIAPGILVGSHTLAAFYSYFLLRYYELNPDGKDNVEQYKNAKRKHSLLIIFIVIVLMIFFWSNINGYLWCFSPIIVGVFIISFLIIIIEVFISTPKLLIDIFSTENTKSLRRIALKFSLLLLVIFFIYNFFNNINRHDIRKDMSKNIYYERQDLEKYFQKWVEERKVNDNDTIPIYLVSGQGGGSRAGSWFLMNMLKLDLNDTLFYKHTFSISTVSGSSSGANMFLAIQNLKQKIKPEALLDDKYKRPYDIAKSIYNKNYINSAVFGLIISDLYWKNDRNSILQLEEKKALQECFSDSAEFLHRVDSLEVSEEQKEILILNKRKHDKKKSDEIDRYFENDYMDPYKNGSTKTPLFLINTTSASSGMKAVFSPVSVNETKPEELPKIFNAVDVYQIVNNSKKEIKSNQLKKSKNINEKGMFILPMVTCVNQSQAFPIANSYNYLDTVGRLCDGGAIENTGIGTTMELYEELLKYRTKVEKKSKVKLKFIFINLLNSKITEPQAVKFSKSTPFDIVNVVSHSIFNASQFLIKTRQQDLVGVHNLELSENEKDVIYNLQLDENVALTRLLSNKTISYLDVKGNDEVEKMITIQNLSHRKDGDPLIPSKSKDVTNLPLVYIQKDVESWKDLEIIKSAISKENTFNLKRDELIKGLNIKKNQIRFFNEADKNIAEKLRDFIYYKTGDSPIVKNFSQDIIGSRVPLNQVELWMVKKNSKN